MILSGGWSLDDSWEHWDSSAREVFNGRKRSLYVTKDLFDGSSSWSQQLTFVTLKTSGERGYLVCKESGSCTLHLDSGVHIDIPNSKSDVNSYGFILDVEVIKQPITTTPLFIIAFDVLEVDPRHVIFSDVKFDKWTHHIPDSTIDRNNMLCAILNNVDIKGLISKPIFPAIDSLKLWGSIESFPYPVDGLIFLSTKPGRTILKWKPANKVTINVALHEEKGTRCFLPHIGSKGFTDQYPFYRFASPGVFEYACSCGDEDEDESTTLIDTVRIQHLQEDSLVIKTCKRECSHQELQDRNQLVVVSSDCPSFSGYQIAEVKLDIKLGTLHFQRLRCDKREPTNGGEIQKIVQFAMQPTELSFIVDAKIQEESDHDIKENASLGQRKKAKLSSRSLVEFHDYIYKLHAFVFDTFCGKNVIDVGCGCLNMLKEAYVDNVWAISNVQSCIEAGKQKAREIEHPHIEVLEINLKESQTRLCQLTEKVDSVFCNSGFQHFWDTAVTTQVFLRNLVPSLKRGGVFVVTFMCLESIPHDSSTFQLNGDGGSLEFQVLLQIDRKTAIIYDKLAGASHEECLLSLEEVKKQFKKANLSFLANYTFEQLGNVAPSMHQELDGLSLNLRKISSFFCCAIFQKTTTDIKIHDDVLISGMVKGLDQDVLKYLSMVDLVSARRVAKFWKLSIDSLDRTFSEENETWMKENLYLYDSRSSFIECLSLPSVGCFLRFGGNMESDSEDESEFEDGNSDYFEPDWDSLPYGTHDQYGDDFSLASGYSYGS
ncbi:hypothetical protein ACHAW6_005038 [Cyclotella cf. meneghiniana]